MSETQKQEKMPWVKSPSGVVDIYVNQTHLTWTVGDVRIRLAQIIDSPQTPTPGPGFQGVCEERAAVTFSWRDAKLLKDNLTKLINSYEDVNGEIKIDIKLPGSID